MARPTGGKVKMLSSQRGCSGRVSQLVPLEYMSMYLPLRLRQSALPVLLLPGVQLVLLIRMHSRVDAATTLSTLSY